MDKKYHWYVVYSWSMNEKHGSGSIEISLDDDVFIPGEISDWIKKNKNFREVVILSWRRLDENQLSPI